MSSASISDIEKVVTAAFEQAMRVAPREYDAKTMHPEEAWRRCNQPNCSVWSGARNPESKRNCTYHAAIVDAFDILKIFLKIR